MTGHWKRLTSRDGVAFSGDEAGRVSADGRFTIRRDWKVSGASWSLWDGLALVGEYTTRALAKRAALEVRSR